MPLIPPKHDEPQQTLAVRVDQAVCERLEQYAEFVHSPKNYVVTQALERVFRGDREFVQWLAARSQPPVDTDGGNDATAALETPRGASARSRP